MWLINLESLVIHETTAWWQKISFESKIVRLVILGNRLCQSQLCDNGYFDLLHLIWATFKDILAMIIEVWEIRAQLSKPIKQRDDNVTLRHDRFVICKHPLSWIRHLKNS